MDTRIKGGSKAKKNPNSSNSSSSSNSSKGSPPAGNLLGQLPPDVLSRVVKFLPVQAQAALGATSKQFNEAIQTTWKVSEGIGLTSRLGPDEALGQFNAGYVQILSNKARLSQDQMCSLLVQLSRQLRALPDTARKSAFDKIVQATAWLQGAWKTLLVTELQSCVKDLGSAKDFKAGQQQLDKLADGMSDAEKSLMGMSVKARQVADSDDPVQYLKLLEEVGGYPDTRREQALLMIVPRLGKQVWNNEVAAALLSLAKRQTSSPGELAAAIGECFNTWSVYGNQVERSPHATAGQQVIDFLMEQSAQLPGASSSSIVARLIDLYPIIRSDRSEAALLQEIVNRCVQKGTGGPEVWNRLLLKLDSLLQSGHKNQWRTADITAVLIHFAHSAPNSQDPMHVGVALKLALELPGEDGKQALSALGALNTRLINKCNFGGVSVEKHCKDRWKMEFLISFADSYAGQWEGLAAGGVYDPLAQALANMDANDRDAIFMMLLRRTKGARAADYAMEALAAHALTHAASASALIQLVSIMPDDASRTALYSAMWKKLIATGNASQNSSSTDLQARKSRLFAMLFEALPSLQDPACRAAHVLNLAFGVHDLANKKEREKFVKQLKAAAKTISPEYAARVKFALKH